MRTLRTLSLILASLLDGSDFTTGHSNSWPKTEGACDDWVVIAGGIDFGYHLDSAIRLYELKGIFVLRARCMHTPGMPDSL